jgi:hypothetical protein
MHRFFVFLGNQKKEKLHWDCLLCPNKIIRADWSSKARTKKTKGTIIIFIHRDSSKKGRGRGSKTKAIQIDR